MAMCSGTIARMMDMDLNANSCTCALGLVYSMSFLVNVCRPQDDYVVMFEKIAEESDAIHSSHH